MHKDLAISWEEPTHSLQEEKGTTRMRWWDGIRHFLLLLLLLFYSCVLASVYNYINPTTIKIENDSDSPNVPSHPTVISPLPRQTSLPFWESLLTFLFLEFPLPRLSYNKNHRLCSLLCLIAFIYHNAF